MLHQNFSKREDLEDLLKIQWKYLPAGIEVMTVCDIRLL
jgi:hypothetical protein